MVTDGRLSGASGKIPAAIHITPEALRGGAIGLIKDGDVVELNAITGELTVNADLTTRSAPIENDIPAFTFGRNLFANLRKQVSSAETGATIFLVIG